MVKKTKSTLLIVMLAIVLTLSVCLVGCGKEPKVTLKSQAEVSLQLGETTVVDYTAENADAVTVKVTKGDADVTGDVYDEAAKKFTAKEVGEFDLTITASVKKKSDSKTVKIKVSEASKTALNEAIAKADALIQSDYSEGWSALKKAKTAAASVAASAASTSEDVQKALSELNAAMDALQAKIVEKAQLGAGKQFTHKGITYDYTTHEEAGIDAAYDKVVALNNDDTKYTLQSQYDKLFSEITASLVERLKMDIDTQGAYVIFSDSKTFRVGVTAAAEASLTYSVKQGDSYGEATAITGGAFEVTVNAGEEKEIRVQGTDGEHSNTKDIKIKAVKASYAFAGGAVNVSTFDPATGKLVNDSFLDWNSGNQKKFVPDVELVGDFEVRATVLFKEGTGDNQAFAINIDQGEQKGTGEFAVRYLFSGKEKGLKAGGGTDPSSDCGDRLEAGKTNTFVLKRVNGVAYLYIEERAEDGAVSKVGEVSMPTFTGPVRVGFNYENIKIEVSDIVFNADSVYNKTALKAWVESTKGYISADYTPDSWAAFGAAKKDATAVLNKIGATQTEIDAAYKALTEKEPVVAAIEKAVIAGDESSVAYGDKNYSSAMYTAETWPVFIAALKELNEKAITGYLPSAYEQEFKELLGAMVSTLKIESNYVLNKVNVTGDLKDVTFKAVTPAGIEVSSYAWKLDGETVNAQTAQTYTAALEGEHSVTSVVTLTEGGVVEVTEKVDVRKGSINSKDGWEKNNYVTAADGSYTSIKGSTGWTDGVDRAWIEDMEFVGSYSVEMDVTYLGAYQADIHVAAIMTNVASDNGQWKSSRAGYAALLFQNGKIEVGKTVDRVQSEDNVIPRADFSVIRIRLSREVLSDGTAKYTTSYIVNGQVVKSVEIVEDNPDLVGNARIGFNAERASVRFSNFSVIADGVVDTTALGEAIAEANKIIIDDYDAADEQVTNFKAALALSKLSYLNGNVKRMLPKGTTQADIDALVAALTQTTAEVKTLSARAVTDSDKPEVTSESAEGAKDGKIVFGGVTYNQANVINYVDVLAAINAIDTTGMTVTEYRTAVKAELSNAVETAIDVDLNELLAMDTGAVKSVGVFGQEVYNFVYTAAGEEVPVLTVDCEPVTMKKVNDTYQYLLIVRKGESHEVKFDNALTEDAHKTLTLNYGAELAFEVRATIDWVQISDDAVTLDRGDPGWGDNWYDRQKAMSGTVITGDNIKVTFTSEFISQAIRNQKIFGMFFGRAHEDGSVQTGSTIGDNVPVFVIKWGEPGMAIELGGDKTPVSGMSFDTSRPYTFVAERHITRGTDGAVTDISYKFSIADPINGEDQSKVVITKGRARDNDYTGPISIKLQWEGLYSSIYGVKVETDGFIYNRKEFVDTLESAMTINPAAYTTETADAFVAALKNAINVYTGELRNYASTDALAAYAAALETEKAALQQAMDALVLAMETKEVSVDLSKQQAHNINFYDDRLYNVTLTNVPENTTVEAYVDGEPAVIADNKVSFVSDNDKPQTELKIIVKNDSGEVINESYVRARTLQTYSKTENVIAKDGAVFNRLSTMEWGDNNLIKAYVVGRFYGENTTVTYKTRYTENAASGNAVQFIMATNNREASGAIYEERSEGRLGVRYTDHTLMGDNQGVADEISATKEIKYDEAVHAALGKGEERVMRLTTSLVDDAGGVDGKGTKLMLKDITGDVNEMGEVGQRIHEKYIGIGFQFENCAGAFYGIEIYEILNI